MKDNFGESDFAEYKKESSCEDDFCEEEID